MKCAQHDIAAGPDGRCALCHTQDKTNARQEGTRLGLILFLGLGTASAALLGVRALMPPSGHSERQAHAEPAPSPARLAPPAPTVATVTAPEAPAQEPPSPPFAVAASDAPAAPVAENVEVAATAGPPPAPAASAAHQPTDAEIRAAMVATPITMYTADWCGTCRRAHEFLQQNGLSCTDRNIDDDPEAYRQLKALSGGTAIPVIDVDGKVLRAGFNARAIATALSESVERRLRVQGVKIAPKAL